LERRDSKQASNHAKNTVFNETMKNLPRNKHDDSTANDEAIARAMLETELSMTMNEFSSATRNQGNRADCPQHHGLELFQASPAQRVTCNGCQRNLRGGEKVWSCVRCNVDACESCYRRGISLQSASSGANFPPRNNSYATASAPRSQSAPPQTPHSTPFPSISGPPHMCMVPCLIGNVTVEMLVDTGAQSSVVSMPVVRQLGLSNRLDRRFMGVAAGVGRARIIGTIQNVVCAFGNGHVEFLMDFMVLDISDPLVLLGLDQMRKYKCLVDLEREALVFGGAGGVEVPMLPAENQHLDVRSLQGGCAVM